jgi:hypothetical protein
MHIWIKEKNKINIKKKEDLLVIALEAEKSNLQGQGTYIWQVLLIASSHDGVQR